MINYNYFSSEFNMQKKNYQQFQEEQETEMHNYPTGIPVGQPVMINPYPQPQQYPVEQYQPQPYYAQPPMHSNQQPHVHVIPQGVAAPPPPMLQQMYFIIKLGLKTTAIPFKFNAPAAKSMSPQL